MLPEFLAIRSRCLIEKMGIQWIAIILEVNSQITSIMGTGVELEGEGFEDEAIAE